MKIRIILVVFFILFSRLSFGQVGDTNRLQWDYPVKPGTEEWKKLENTQARIDACQIPDSVLQNISTGDLMTLCLRYPLLHAVFAFNNINDGLKKLFTDFNGIREFAKREDAITYLREKYFAELGIFPSKLSTDSHLEIGYSIVHISMLEILLSYSDFYTNATTKVQKEVLESLLVGYIEKIKYPDYFQGIGFKTNLFARAHIITKIDAALSSTFEGKNSAVLFSGRTNADVINTIDSLSYKLIK